MIDGAAGLSRSSGRAGAEPCRLTALSLLASVLVGCGGGAPLFHPAHVLRPGKLSAGAGVSGQIDVLPRSATLNGRPSPHRSLEAFTVSPGIAPWVGARLGLRGDNEGGLTVTSRSLRLDGRHAFTFGALTLSLGLGASAVSALPGPGAEGGWVLGGGIDVPLLLGFRSASDLYALWFGPRLGLELLTGRVQIGDAVERADLGARHLFAGLVAGVRVGFRHVHAALELSAAYHRVDATLDHALYDLDQLSLTPGGALIFSF